MKTTDITMIDQQRKLAGRSRARIIRAFTPGALRRRRLLLFGPILAGLLLAAALTQLVPAWPQARAVLQAVGDPSSGAALAAYARSSENIGQVEAGLTDEQLAKLDAAPERPVDPLLRGLHRAVSALLTTVGAADPTLADPVADMRRRVCVWVDEENPNLVHVAVRAHDPELAAALANQVAAPAADFMGAFMVRNAEPETAALTPPLWELLFWPLLGGLVLGALLAGTANLRRRTYEDPADVQLDARTHVAGVVPAIDFADPNDAEAELVALYMPRSPVSEIFRTVRNALTASPIQPHVVLVASPAPRDGRTLVALNLAVALSQAGNKTLLVEGDIRRPRVAEVFKLTVEQGLGDYLKDKEMEDPPVQQSIVHGLDLLPAGEEPQKAGDLLESNRMRNLLFRMRERYDWIVVDSPAWFGVGDGRSLARLSDAALLVVRDGRTPRELLRSMRLEMDALGAPVAAAVYNAAHGEAARKARAGVPEEFPYYETYESIAVDQERTRPRGKRKQSRD